MQIERIFAAPANFRDFANEIAPEFGEVYGARAESEYRAEALSRVSGAIQHPEMRTYQASRGRETIGMAQWFSQGGAAHVSFVHVLTPHAGSGVELALLETAHRDIRNAGLAAISCEMIPFGATEVEAAFGALGFHSLARAFLVRPCHPAFRSIGPNASVRPLAIGQRSEAAGLITRAYANHPDRILHPDLVETTRAQRFLDSVASGAYGPTDDASLIGIVDGRELAGLLVGCESPAGVGFILQVAVDPSHQNQGLGRTLIEHFASHCARRGLERLALGVTRGNPAERLYARLGFRAVRQVRAFVWP